MLPFCQVMRYHVAMAAPYSTCSGFVHAHSCTLLHTLFIIFFWDLNATSSGFRNCVGCFKVSFDIEETNPIWLVFQARTARYR